MIILALRILNYFLFSKLMGPLRISICLREMSGPIVSVATARKVGFEGNNSFLEGLVCCYRVRSKNHKQKL